jgi:uncharacterized OsmC-like protein
MTTATTNAKTNKNATGLINGINPDAVHELIGAVKRNPAEGFTRWGVTTRWQEGCVSETEVAGFEIAGKRVRKNFKLHIDEPHELGGTNTAANPQEYLLAAFNACMLVGYVVQASLHGVELESLEIETKGDIDLRGFLGLDERVKPGYDSLHYTVHIKGNGTPEQFKQIHEAVTKTSPNRFNIANPIALTSDLVVG